jgi:hypothetical protein
VDWTFSSSAERRQRCPGSGTWLIGPAARTDRWGIFAGEWAPTFFGLGVALSRYEQQDGTFNATVHEVREQRAG